MMAGITITNLTDVTNGVTTSVAALVANPGADGISLREAILAANAAADEDIIEFAPALTSGGPASIDLTQGQLTITNNLTIDGLGAEQLTIDAQGNSRLFWIISGVTVGIRGVTLTGGHAAGVGGAGTGGGIYNNGDLTLDSVVLSGNEADESAGGIYVSNVGSLRLIDSTVDSNTSTFGGGIMGHFAAGERLYVSGSTISNNTATGIAVAGGLNFVSVASSGQAVGTIINSTISGNTASWGGGVHVYGTSGLTIANSTITGNQAAGPAGAQGGGIRALQNGHVTLHNTIVAGNNAALSGSQDLFIFSGADFNPSVSSYNLIGIGNGSGLADGTNGNQLGTTAAPKNAALAPLGDYGGPTQTHALLIGSTGIEAGNPSAVAGQNGVPLFDQRGAGFGRVVNGDSSGGARLDVGAIEFQSTPLINGIAEAFGTNSADTIVITDSTLTINGGSYDVSSATMIVVYGLAGNDVINASAATKPVRIYGGDGADTITGGAGSDFLYGGEGNDDILAGQGDDQLSGDAGNDKLQGNAGNDTLEGGLGDDQLGGGALIGVIGGEGHDTYVYSGTESLGTDLVVETHGSDTFDFSALDYGIGVDVDRGADEVEVSHNGKQLTIDLNFAHFLIENVIGTIYADRFTGTNVVTQEDSTYAGGAGNDTYYFKGTDITIVELPGEGTDTIDFSQLSTIVGVTLSLSSNAPQQVWFSSNLTLVNPLGLENVIGTTKNDVLTGNANDNYLAGGLGNDTYKIAGDTDQGRDTIFDAIGLGTDTIDFSGLDFGSGVTFDLRENGNSNYEVIDENGKQVVLDLTNAQLENVTGTRYDDTLVGNSGNNIINGGAGNDWLQGREGTDTLNDGTGNDTYNLIAGQTLATDVVSDADGYSIQFPNGTTSSRPFIEMSPQFDLLGEIIATDDWTVTIATVSDVESAIGNLDIDVTGIDSADITITPAGEILWSPDSDEIDSDYQVTITVTDQESLTNTIIFTASVVADIDSDGDGLDDLVEINTVGSNPFSADTDEDELPDGFEHASNVLDPLVPDDPNGDHDADGLPNIAEFAIGTNPDVWDTDGNGLNDLDGSDFDGDGLNYVNETTLGTDPDKFDSDLDLLSDGFETQYGLASAR